jgi:hypothetical protein
LSEGAKFRAGVVRTGPSPESGPTRFPARWQGKEGYAVVTGSMVGWVKGDVDKDGGERGTEMEWTLRIGEVHVSFDSVPGVLVLQSPYSCPHFLPLVLP